MITHDAFLQLLHYITTAAVFILPLISVAISQGFASKVTLQAIQTQPGVSSDVKKTFFLNIAINETIAILSIVLGMYLFLQKNLFHSLWSYFGLFSAFAFPAIISPFVSYIPYKAALDAIVRQPFSVKDIIRLLFIILSIIQTSVILGLIILFFIKIQAHNLSDMAICAAGMAFGLGSIGSSIGLGIFSQAAFTALSKNMDAYSVLTSFIFICQGLIETPMLLSLLTSMLILSNVQKIGIICFAAALTIIFSTLGAGISSGFIANRACLAIGKYPKNAPFIIRISFFAQALIDALPIYGLVIVLIMLFAL